MRPPPPGGVPAAQDIIRSRHHDEIFSDSSPKVLDDARAGGKVESAEVAVLGS